jgi:hypothetical protein
MGPSSYEEKNEATTFIRKNGRGGELVQAVSYGFKQIMIFPFLLQHYRTAVYFKTKEHRNTSLCT